MTWEIRLLGWWQLKRDGETIEVGLRQQRLITALALLGERPRQFLSGLLWPDSSEAQASGNLRAALFKISHQLPGLLDNSTEPVSLSNLVAVDLHEFRLHMDWVKTAGTVEVAPGLADALRSAELLPGWYDDWVLFEQERLREQRVQALESVSCMYLLSNDMGRAFDAARSAAAIEPLRESAQRLLIEIQLRVGNAAGAHRTLIDFKARLRDELGLEPSEGLRKLLGGTEFRSPALGSHPGPAAAVHAVTGDEQRSGPRYLPAQV